MKRVIDWHLMAWKTASRRKPLLLKGARQIGKTYAVRELGRHFESMVELNFELLPEARTIFEKDLNPERIIWELGLLFKTEIIPGNTLLFLDEIQVAPKAILALRYFYELMPSLHVIAAGSLIDFALEKVGMPVGRVTILYLYPLSFMEFLSATGNKEWIKAILEKKFFSEMLHHQILDLLITYLAIGGMPEAVRAWIETKDPKVVYEAQKSLTETYRQDFPKYAKQHELPYLDILFNQIPHFIGKQIKYSAFHGEYQKRELAPCLSLLVHANVVHQVIHTAANGIPLGAEVNLERFKTLLLDVGLAQSILGLDFASWLLNPDKEIVNRGVIVENFVGQELLAYDTPKSKGNLYFWKRESKGALSEIDYVYDMGSQVVPIEVKSGAGSTLRSMHQFLEEHPKSPFGIRFSSLQYSVIGKIDSRPLYAIASLAHSDQKDALMSLCN